MSEILKLRDELRGFADERDWDQFHSPKNLAMALAGEVGELVSELQWKSEDQSFALDEKQLQAIEEEVADVDVPDDQVFSLGGLYWYHK